MVLEGVIRCRWFLRWRRLECGGGSDWDGGGEWGWWRIDGEFWWGKMISEGKRVSEGWRRRCLRVEIRSESRGAMETIDDGGFCGGRKEVRWRMKVNEYWWGFRWAEVSLGEGLGFEGFWECGEEGWGESESCWSEMREFSERIVNGRGDLSVRDKEFFFLSFLSFFLRTVRAEVVGWIVGQWEVCTRERRWRFVTERRKFLSFIKRNPMQYIFNYPKKKIYLIYINKN